MQQIDRFHYLKFILYSIVKINNFLTVFIIKTLGFAKLI